MGTTLSDTMYAGLAHAASPATHVISPKQLRAIESRWLEWSPLCVQRARQQPDFSTAILTFKSTHRTRILQLLTSQIKWKTIRLHKLDCPTDSLEDFEAKRNLVRRRRLRRKF